VFLGQASLPSSCPVCEHTPVSAADCIVYKSLRTTIRVFIKTEEKKREAAKPKANGSAPTTPVQATPTHTPAQDQAVANPPAGEASISEEPVPAEPLANDTKGAVAGSPDVENKPTTTDRAVSNQPEIVGHLG